MDSADVDFVEPKDLLARGHAALPQGTDAQRQALTQAQPLGNAQRLHGHARQPQQQHPAQEEQREHRGGGTRGALREQCQGAHEQQRTGGQRHGLARRDSRGHRLPLEGEVMVHKAQAAKPRKTCGEEDLPGT